MWEYRATPVHTVDGDTIDVVTDLGFGIDGMNMRLRLLGIDTPERSGDTKPAGDAALAFTKNWLTDNADADGRILIVTIKDRSSRDKKDSFGRYLAVVWDMAKTRTLNQDLIAAGHAVVYQ